MALQLLVVLVTVAASVITILNPACFGHLLAEVVRAMSAGLLLASVKAIVKVSRPSISCKSVWCWCRCWRDVMWREAKYGLIAGYLLGLLMAMWTCWNG